MSVNNYANAWMFGGLSFVLKPVVCKLFFFLSYEDGKGGVGSKWNSVTFDPFCVTSSNHQFIK